MPVLINQVVAEVASPTTESERAPMAEQLPATPTEQEILALLDLARTRRERLEVD